MKETSSVKELAKKLGLYNIANSDYEFPKAIPKEKHIDYFVRILQQEQMQRDVKARARRQSNSRLDNEMTFDSFETRAIKGIMQWHVEEFEKLKWLEKMFNVIFIGQAGTGKTHLANAIGNQVIASGKKVYCVNFNELLIWLSETDNKTYRSKLKYIRECSVIVVDEIGYLPITRLQALAFYGFVKECESKVSLVMTTNKEFREWGDLVGDEMLATAIIDRLTHKCQVIGLKGESYRLRFHQNIFQR